MKPQGARRDSSFENEHMGGPSAVPTMNPRQVGSKVASLSDARRRNLAAGVAPKGPAPMGQPSAPPRSMGQPAAPVSRGFVPPLSAAPINHPQHAQPIHDPHVGAGATLSAPHVADMDLNKIRAVGAPVAQPPHSGRPAAPSPQAPVNNPTAGAPPTVNPHFGGGSTLSRYIGMARGALNGDARQITGVALGVHKSADAHARWEASGHNAARYVDMARRGEGATARQEQIFRHAEERHAMAHEKHGWSGEKHQSAEQRASEMHNQRLGTETLRQAGVAQSIEHRENIGAQALRGATARADKAEAGKRQAEEAHSADMQRRQFGVAAAEQTALAATTRKQTASAVRRGAEARTARASGALQRDVAAEGRRGEMHKLSKKIRKQNLRAASARAERAEILRDKTAQSE